MTTLSTSRPRSASEEQPRLWPRWVFLVAFTLVGFESILLAFALKNEMLVLLAPGVICTLKAIDTWRELRPHLHWLGRKEA